jgi:dihydropyrimidinase
MKMTGVPSHTVSHGKIVYKNGELRAVKGAGRYIKRPAFDFGRRGDRMGMD